jgi:uncharacterized protein YaaQ
MDKNLNFDDNSYIIMLNIQYLKNVLAMDLEPQIYSDKILNDIDFTDKLLETLLNFLMENEFLIDRAKELNKLEDLEWRFEQLLSGLYGQSALLQGINNSENNQKISNYKNNCKKRKNIITSTVSKNMQNKNNEPIVSTLELNKLLNITGI